ncbi:MAG: ecotin family protein [Verrucomicrobiota bacterium]
MKIFVQQIIGVWLVLWALSGLASAGDKPMFADAASKWEKAYPEAKQGMVRYVLHLQPQPDEFACQVDLIVGKTIETDGANHYAFGGEIVQDDVPGWGYPRYTARPQELAQTLMAPPPNAPNVKKFVTLTGPYLIRYNSLLPVVVYVPEGFEVRYRIWKAQPENPIPKG